MKPTYRIVNIHENRAFPGVVCATLVDMEGHIVIGATLLYIFEVIKERGYEDVENVTIDKYGNLHLFA
jgi:hypothetical protein